MSSVRLAVVAALAVGGTAGSLWYTARTYGLGLRTQVADRYSTGVEQLAHQNESVQIGAMYALKTLALSYPDYRPVVIDVIAAYVRDVDSAEKSSRRFSRRRTQASYRRRDIALATMCGLLESTIKHPVDLRGVDLTGARLGEVNLVDADLRDTRLLRTFLAGSDLRGADLRGAELSQDVQLYRAKVAGARFDSTDAVKRLLRSSQVEGLASVQWDVAEPGS